MNKALIVVDLQKDFIDGALPVQFGDVVAVNVAELIRVVHYDVIAVTRDWHIAPGDHFSLKPNYRTTWPVHCVAGTEGATLDPLLTEAVTASDAAMSGRAELFSKGKYAASYSGFDGLSSQEVPLDLWLRGNNVDAVDIVGLAYDYCVAATARSAIQMDYITRVLRDCTGSVNPDDNETTTAGLRSLGIEVVHAA